ncbi:MAG: glycosyl transferase [Muribaculaceae bacterium]|nr:glycosyl transferase [Muribaculaceae bacterium]
MIKKYIFNLIKTSKIKIVNNILIPTGRLIPDPLYISIQFYLHLGKWPNLKNPKTFNEKLQWLKLNDRKPEYTIMVDKIEAKKWVADKIGEEYIIPTLGVWEKAEDIDFDSLPDQFVLKTNHDSGRVVICKDKSVLEKDQIKKEMSLSLKRDFYSAGREWPYKNVKRRILAEELLKSKTENCEESITDYKFMCFNGKVKCSFVCTERRSKGGVKVTFFDNEWKRLPFTRHYPASTKELPKPINLKKMIELAEILSKGTKFLRVDFYEVNGAVYFSELTFYPGCGYEEFTPEEFDIKLGNLINLY